MGGEGGIGSGLEIGMTEEPFQNKVPLRNAWQESMVTGHGYGVEELDIGACSSSMGSPNAMGPSLVR